MPTENDPNELSVPCFQIKYWNVYRRVLKELPRTNNNIEAWHKSLSQDIESHPTFVKLLKHLRREQRLTEKLFDEIKQDVIFQRSKKETKKDEAIKTHLKRECSFDAKKYIFKTKKNIN